jgi:hypothetical protein
MSASPSNGYLNALYDTATGTFRALADDEVRKEFWR